MDILIIGGNRFFGKRLAKMLLNEGHVVTLLNRGTIDDGFGDKIERIVCDRTDGGGMQLALEGRFWDVVYDQVCFDYPQATYACEVFKGKVGRYIFTSSQSVYEPGRSIAESVYDPKEHKFDKLETGSSNYAEAKRQAEVGFYKHASFPVVSVRFPIVVGQDDYTERFKFHVDRIQQGQSIYFPNINAKISLISSEFAARVLFALADISFIGPINAASSEAIVLRDIIGIIERALGKKCELASRSVEENDSPYGILDDWYMDCSQLKDLDLVGSEIVDWLPKLLE